MKPKKLFLFLFLITILLSYTVYSTDDWKTYRYDTLHDSVPESTFSRFDLGINVIKSFSFGNIIQPRVIKTNWNDVNETANLIIFGDDDIIRLYNQDLTLGNSKVGHVITSETHIEDVFQYDEAFDIFIIEKDGVLNTQNFTWIQYYDNKTFSTIYSINFGNTSKGVNCNWDSAINNLQYYCVWTNDEQSNQTTFHRTLINSDRTVDYDVLDVGDEGNHANAKNYLNSIPTLRDVNHDNNLDAVYLSFVDGISATADIVMIDVTTLSLKGVLDGDGIKEDVTIYQKPTDLILVNVDGIDDNNFDIIFGDEDNIFIFSPTGTQRLNKDINTQCDNQIRSISRTDMDEDASSTYDIIAYCSQTVNSQSLVGINLNGDIVADIQPIHPNAYCGGTPTGQIVMTDLDNTGTANTVYSTVTPCGIHLNVYSATQINSEIIFNQSGFETTSPIVADITNNNLYEVIYSKSGNTTIYSSSYINSPAVLSNYTIDTGTPVCAGSTVLFTCNGNEPDGELFNCGIDLLSNGTIIWGSFSTLSPTVDYTFTADDIGTEFDMRIHVSDEGHPFNTEISLEIDTIYRVVSENATLCHDSGEGGISESGGVITTPSSERLDDMIDVICDIFGVCNTETKAFIFLIMLIMITIGTIQATKSAVITIVVDFAFTIVASLPSVNLIPAWVSLLIVILATGITVLFGKGLFFSGEGK